LPPGACLGLGRVLSTEADEDAKHKMNERYTALMEKLLDENVLSDLLEYASTVAAGQQTERTMREAAFHQMKVDNPELAELLACIAADEWQEAEQQLRSILGKPVAPYVPSGRRTRFFYVNDDGLPVDRQGSPLFASLPAENLLTD